MGDKESFVQGYPGILDFGLVILDFGRVGCREVVNNLCYPSPKSRTAVTHRSPIPSTPPFRNRLLVPQIVAWSVG